MLQIKFIFIFYCVLFILTGNEVLAQNIQISFYYKSGTLITHRASIPQELRGLHPTGLELNWSRSFKGDKSWHHAWGRPQYGLSAGYWNLDQPEYLGQLMYLKAFFQKDLLRKASKHDLNIRIGTGVSYHTEKYDSIKNTVNNLNSQSINLMLEISMDYQFAIQKRLYGSIGFGINHFSNASTQFPNIGLNIPYIKAGLSYRWKDAGFLKDDPSEVSSSKHPPYWNALLSLASKSAGQEFQDNDIAYSLSISYLIPVDKKLTFVSSIDYMYNNTIRRILQNTAADQKRLGIAIGWQLDFGQTAFQICIGHYIHRPEKSIDEAVYHRFGLRHHIYKGLFISAQLKSHKVRADVLEWGLGIRF